MRYFTDKPWLKNFYVANILSDIMLLGLSCAVHYNILLIVGATAEIEDTKVSSRSPNNTRHFSSSLFTNRGLSSTLK